MPRVVVNETQLSVLRAVRDAHPFSTPGHLAKTLPWSAAVIQHTLDALTRRNLVTPSENWGSSAIYEVTSRGLKVAA